MTKREIIARAKAGFEKARREPPGVLFAKLVAYGTIDRDGNVVSSPPDTHPAKREIRNPIKKS